jgi:hypothetical protein
VTPAGRLGTTPINQKARRSGGLSRVRAASSRCDSTRSALVARKLLLFYSLRIAPVFLEAAFVTEQVPSDEQEAAILLQLTPDTVPPVLTQHFPLLTVP